MTKSRKISYTNEMVLAREAGRKRMTRRIMNPQPFQNHCAEEFTLVDCDEGSWLEMRNDGGITGEWHDCPQGAVGDHLWLQEGYRVDTDIGAYTGNDVYPNLSRIVEGVYLADDAHFTVELTEHEYELWMKRKFCNRATPGRFMYRSLSRSTDKITNIRVERVQDISEDDAKDEGVPVRCDCGECVDGNHRAMFEDLWNKINGKKADWESNPWVWVIEFEPVLRGTTDGK